MATVHPRFKTPTTSLVVQCSWACILTLTGSYDQLFTYVIFASWIFYALGAGGIFIMRRRLRGNPEGRYRVPGYPVVPILFVVVATWFVVNTIVKQTDDSMVGLLLLVAGLPFYYYWEKKMRTAG